MYFHLRVSSISDIPFQITSFIDTILRASDRLLGVNILII